ASGAVQAFELKNLDEGLDQGRPVTGAALLDLVAMNQHDLGHTLLHGHLSGPSSESRPAPSQSLYSGSVAASAPSFAAAFRASRAKPVARARACRASGDRCSSVTVPPCGGSTRKSCITARSLPIRSHIRSRRPLRWIHCLRTVVLARI